MSQSQTAIEDLAGRPLTTLSEDEQMFRASVREFAAGELRPRVEQMDEHAKLDPALIKQCFDLGLMGIETPEEFGGAGSSFFTAILAVEELSRVDASVGVFVDVQNTLVNNAFIHWGNQEQKAKYLPMLAQDKVGAYALSEAGSGSDAFAMQTRAVDKGDHYLLNGQKLWITNGNEAEIFVLFANANPEAGYRGITAFIVEKGFAGFTVGKKENKLGIRASSTTELILVDCKVPKENVLGEVGKGYKTSIETLNEGRIGIGAQMIGPHGTFAVTYCFPSQTCPPRHHHAPFRHSRPLTTSRTTRKLRLSKLFFGVVGRKFRPETCPAKVYSPPPRCAHVPVSIPALALAVASRKRWPYFLSGSR